MRNHLLAGAAVGALALTLISAAPASAVEWSDRDLDLSRELMLDDAMAKQAKLPSGGIEQFIITKAVKGNVGRIWLCEVGSSASDVFVAGAPTLLQASTGSHIHPGIDETMTIATLTQSMYVYDTEAKAKRAFDALTKKAATCSGKLTEQVGQVTSNSVVSNGTGKAKDGDTYVWIASGNDASAPGTTFTDDEYSTFRQVGRTIMQVNLDNEGPTASTVTKADRKSVDTLTDSLGDAWRSTFQ